MLPRDPRPRLPLETLQGLIAKKSVKASRHPRLPLTLYNYTNAAYSIKPSEWPLELSQARALVLDDTGNVVSRGFGKFWELTPSAVQKIEDNKEKAYTISEKMDGVLICVFVYQGEVIVHTRGSWDNEFINEAVSLFEDQYPEYWHNLLDDPDELGEGTSEAGIDYGRTDCFELISPVSRIVVDYGGKRSLTWLQSFRIYNQSMGELNGADVQPLCDLGNHAYLCDAHEVKGWSLSKQYTPLITLESFTSKASNGQEGYVIYLPWCNEYYKFKFDDYKAKHRAVFQTSDMSVWDTLRYGPEIAQDLVDCTAKIDQSLSKWIAAKVNWFAYRKNNILREAIMIFDSIDYAPTRTDYAKIVLQKTNDRLAVIKSIMFALYDGDNQLAENLAMKAVKPAKTTFYRHEDLSA